MNNDSYKIYSHSNQLDPNSPLHFSSQNNNLKNESKLKATNKNQQISSYAKFILAGLGCCLLVGASIAVGKKLFARMQAGFAGMQTEINQPHRKITKINACYQGKCENLSVPNNFSNKNLVKLCENRPAGTRIIYEEVTQEPGSWIQGHASSFHKTSISC